jgi:hypothetical protein
MAHSEVQRGTGGSNCRAFFNTMSEGSLSLKI